MFEKKEKKTKRPIYNEYHRYSDNLVTRAAPSSLLHYTFTGSHCCLEDVPSTGMGASQLN